MVGPTLPNCLFFPLCSLSSPPGFYRCGTRLPVHSHDLLFLPSITLRRRKTGARNTLQAAGLLCLLAQRKNGDCDGRGDVEVVHTYWWGREEGFHHKSRGKERVEKKPPTVELLNEHDGISQARYLIIALILSYPKGGMGKSPVLFTLAKTLTIYVSVCNVPIFGGKAR